MSTALELSPEQLKKYKPTKNWVIRHAQRAAVEMRRVDALLVAKNAANILREKFGAKKVVAFGSLADKGCFNYWSDIDLAAWGIAPDVFYSAVAAVTGLSPVFRIDLVDPDTCRQVIKEAIQKQGIEL